MTTNPEHAMHGCSEMDRDYVMVNFKRWAGKECYVFIPGKSNSGNTFHCGSEYIFADAEFPGNNFCCHQIELD